MMNAQSKRVNNKEVAMKRSEREAAPLNDERSEDDSSRVENAFGSYQSTSQTSIDQPLTQFMTESTRVVKFSANDESQKNRHVYLRHHDDSRFLRHDGGGTQASWMTTLAYSFRSPRVGHARHKRMSSSALTEYPHSIASSFHDEEEQQPLVKDAPIPLPPKEPVQQRDSSVCTNHVAIAATFLQDYEANRPPSLSPDLSEISDWQLRLHQIKFGFAASCILSLATLSLFVSSFLEGGDLWALLTALNFFAISVFSVELWLRHQLRGRGNPDHPRVRDSRSGRLVKPLILFGLVLACENITRYVIPTSSVGMTLLSGFFKPVVLFYASYRARDALEAVRRIIKTVLRVLAIELLLILMFAAVACRLFGEYEQFRNLSNSWLSLFELATTVVNPSIWMPMYQDSKYSAFFFIFFIVTTVFYLHSLVLSVVFQTYVHAATEIHERSVADQEDAIHLAYVALKQSSRRDVVDTRLVRKMLEILRPHYNAMKINALVNIVDPSHQKFLDYETFRTKIRQALNTSIRTARNPSTIAMIVELLAVVVTIVNFIYVIMVSSTFNEAWFNDIQEVVGCVITLVAGLELLIRFNPFRIADFTPLTRLNATFDGLALVAALISCLGILFFVSGHPSSLQLLLMGRAIDITRTMRFFDIFRDVVRRSADVLPALTGPIIVLITTLHVFVYLGMALWGGAISVGSHADEITYLYDMNNFNSYQEGVVTMFQVLVVNDWHAIAQVFLYADRCSSPYIVYPFFVTCNLIGVSIMLNVLTAFFVQSFVAKIDDESDDKMEFHRDFSIRTSENSSIRRISSSASLAGIESGSEADNSDSSESNSIEFDVYEREGFDKIMQTVAGGSYQSDFARKLCNYLEIYESLAPERDTLGYLICDQETLERFGNHRFKNRAKGFLEVNELHVIVSDMHSELLTPSSRASFRDRSLTRKFPHREEPDAWLEISAALLRRQPALSLFVARHTKAQR
jgi:hypothetical protein